MHPGPQPELRIPFCFAGFISMIISGGTILSSLLSSRILRRTVIPLGSACRGSARPRSRRGRLGLNAYIAEHYESRHMSWLHSFWGVGAVIGPLLISGFISSGISPVPIL